MLELQRLKEAFQAGLRRQEPGWNLRAWTLCAVCRERTTQAAHGWTDNNTQSLRLSAPRSGSVTPWPRDDSLIYYY